MVASPLPTSAPLADLHARFAGILPAVQSESRVAFSGLRHVEDREDAEADAALAAWLRFLRAAAMSAVVDPVDLARRAVASVVRRLRHRARFAV